MYAYIYIVLRILHIPELNRTESGDEHFFGENLFQNKK